MTRLALTALLVGMCAPAVAQVPADGATDRSPAAIRASQDPAVEARASALASELRCPVCQGLSIQDSPSPLAVQMKDLIRVQVAEGRTDEEVREYFISKYGEWVLLEPRASGFNLLVYLMPALALLGGAVLIFTMVRRWSAASRQLERMPPAP